MGITRKGKKFAIKMLDNCVSAICKSPIITDKYETIRKITEEGCSAARFGDGELGLICGRPLGFQKVDPALSDRLAEVLSSDVDSQLLICVSKAIWTVRSDFYSKYRVRYLWRINKYLRSDKTYYGADISRFYKASDDGIKELEYLSQLKMIWKDRNITIIEGEKSRMGIGNDLFADAACLKRILCPAEDAFSYYDEIYAKALTIIPKDELVLIALGPTATVLAYDLFLAGFQAVDIGHVDISYEWFLRGVTGPDERVPIPGKYVNEASGGNIVEDSTDEEYLSQIIASVGI